MKSILSILSIALASICLGQSPYVFSTYTEDYIEIVDGTPIDVFDVSETTWDDPDFTVPLYNFDILGQSFNSTTQVSVGGLMGFLEDNNAVIHGFGLDVDIMDGAVLEGNTPSEISYVSNITPESTTTIIQFSNVAFYEEIEGPEPGTVNRMNFQIRFDTPSNAMSIHFGPSNIPNPELVFYGASGPSIVLGIGLNDQTGFINYAAQVSGDPANPTLIETFNAMLEEANALNSMPASGRVYRFEPAEPTGVPEHDKAVYSINPSLTTDYINVIGDIQQNATYRIFDISGKEIENGLILNNKTIDVSELQSGLYLFSIDGMSSAEKFIKM